MKLYKAIFYENINELLYTLNNFSCCHVENSPQYEKDGVNVDIKLCSHMYGSTSDAMRLRLSIKI
jgi:hypothetical protein